MKFKGIDFLLKIKSGETFVVLGGQRGATLNRSAETMDVTTKDSGGWKENLAGLKEFSIDADGLIVESNTAYQALEDAFNDGTAIDVELSTPNDTTYTGKVLVTDFPIELPYDDTVTYSVTLTGTGALTKVV
jgi:TP901-1 family phage major tail protein